MAISNYLGLGQSNALLSFPQNCQSARILLPSRFFTTMTDQHAAPIVAGNNANNGLWITLINYITTVALYPLATDSHDNQPTQVIRLALLHIWLMHPVKELRYCGFLELKMQQSCQAGFNNHSVVIYVSLFPRVTRFVLTALVTEVHPFIKSIKFILAFFLFSLCCEGDIQKIPLSEPVHPTHQWSCQSPSFRDFQWRPQNMLLGKEDQRVVGTSQQTDQPIGNLKPG